MPKVPHGSGLDARTSETEYIRERGFGHEEIRAGVTKHGGIRVQPHETPMSDYPARREHGWAAGFPIGGAVPAGDCGTGTWDFTQACQSGHLLTAGM